MAILTEEGSWPRDWITQDAVLNEMLRLSRHLPDDDLVGYVYSMPHADGRAWYLVTSMEPLTLQHIPYLDAYKLADAYIRGLTVEDIKRWRDMNRALNRPYC